MIVATAKVKKDDTQTITINNNLSIYRLLHPEYRVGAIVIARSVKVYIPEKGKQHYVEVDGVKLKGFCGASVICDLNETQSNNILSKIKKDIISFESI